MEFGLVFLLAAGMFVQQVPAPAEAPPVVREMRVEVTRPNAGPAGRPLPVAAHWANGYGRDNFSSDYQVELLQRGHHVLPTLPMPRPGRGGRQVARGQRLVEQLARWGAPFTLRAGQWEDLLLSKDHPQDDPGRWRNLPPDQNPLVLTLLGKIEPRISPFGGVEAWYEVGRYQAASEGMAALQRWYPDPPFVILLSNNEARRLEPKHQVTLTSRRYVSEHGVLRSGSYLREVMGEGYAVRYRRMLEGLREGLSSPAWRQNARFVAYGAFGPSHFGRGDWNDNQYATDERISPWPLVWEGGSPPYYTHDWNASSDYRVFSPQIEAMNWVFMLEEAYAENPSFWFEMSVWDGNSGKEGKQDKVDVYRKAGQTYTPERYAGFVQFGMWLLRPRAVREFKGSSVARADFAPYFEALVAAVDRVWEEPVLTSFWRNSTLVPNPEGQHPYQDSIPDRWRDVDRWFLLDTSLSPPQPWTLETEIPVFALARVRGPDGRREWLLYAHAPLRPYEDVTVEVPGYGPVSIDVTPGGSFYIVHESDHSLLPLHSPSR